MEDNEYWIYPKIWGPSAWFFLHCVTFIYPDNPTNNDKENFKTFFTSIKNILPCKWCRMSYSKFITEDETTILNDKVLSSRNNLIEWFYKIHNKVNNKTHCNYDLTFKDFKDKYKTFVLTGNEISDNDKKRAFLNCNLKYPKKIPKEIASKFIKYSLIRGLKNYKKILLNNEDIVNKNKDYVIYYCNKLMFDIKLLNNGIESSGKYKGLPSIKELSIMRFLYTTLDNDEIKKSLEILSKSEYKN